MTRESFTGSLTTSTCPRKGQARYYHVRVDGEVNHDAVWCYTDPSPAAGKIARHGAFWHGVRVERVPGPGEEERGGTGRGLGGRILGRLHRMGAHP